MKTRFGQSLLLMLVFGSGTVSAHDLQYQVEQGESVSVRLSLPYGEPPIYEPYEVFAPDSEVPFQVGRSDARGRIIFHPDQAGSWRVRVVTEDGHGLDVTLDLDESGTLETVHGPGLGRIVTVTAALGYFLGLTGLLLWWHQRRSRQH